MASAELLDEPQAELVAVDSSESLYEEIDGRRVELPPMSTVANLVSNELAQRLGEFVRARSLGRVVMETLIRLPISRPRNRRPDAIFVPFDRWPADRPLDPTQNAWDVVPALVIEVVSPTDLAEELSNKINEYFESGVSQVWVIYPIARAAMIYMSLDQARQVRDNDILDGGTVVPGWSVRLADILPPVIPQPESAE